MIVIASLIISFFLVKFIRFCMRDQKRDSIESMEKLLGMFEIFSRMEVSIDKESYLRIGKRIKEVNEVSRRLNDPDIDFLADKVIKAYDRLKVKGE
jgi:hypothetical protein